MLLRVKRQLAGTASKIYLKNGYKSNGKVDHLTEEGTEDSEALRATKDQRAYGMQIHFFSHPGTCQLKAGRLLSRLKWLTRKRWKKPSLGVCGGQ